MQIFRCCAVLAHLSAPRAAEATPPAPGPSFIFARYVTHSSLALYAGYGAGPWFAFAGMVNNPRSGYRESLLGAGRHVRVPHGTVTIGVAGADAEDSRYAQLYLVPTFTVSALTLDGTVELYTPLESRGVTQAYLNPVSLLGRIVPRLQVGVTYLYFEQHGTATGHALGPALRVGFPNGTITLDLVRRLRNVSPETRITVQTAF